MTSTSPSGRPSRLVPMHRGGARPGPHAPGPGGPGGPGVDGPGVDGLDAETETMRTAPPPAASAPPSAPAPPSAAPPAPRPARARRPDPEPDGDDAPATPARRNGMGTPALVLGLLALAIAASYLVAQSLGQDSGVTGWAMVVLGLPAVVAGYLGARRAFHGLATDGASSLGGLATGLIDMIVGVVVVWPTLFGSGAFGDGLTLDQCLTQATTAKEMHMCKSQHLAEFNQRFPNAAE